MRKIFLISASIVLLSSSAYADNNFYGKVALGWGYTPNNKVTVYSNKESKSFRSKGSGILGLGAIGFGYNANNNNRLDVEFFADDGISSTMQFNCNSITSKVKTRAALINAYYDFKNKSDITPFIMGGAGYAVNKINVKTEHRSYGKKSNALIYQVGAGVSYSITPKIALEIGYRFINKGVKKQNISNYSKVAVHSQRSSGHVHAFLIGSRIGF